MPLAIHNHLTLLFSRQAQTQYVTSSRYVPRTQYAEVTSVVRVPAAPETRYTTVPVYVTRTQQLPDQIRTVYQTQTRQQRVQTTVVVTRPEYRQTTVTQTLPAKCGYSYPEPAKQLQYGK